MLSLGILKQRYREHAFKLPQRITLSEVRRQSWHTDFFNPEVPLHTISEKIPHAKGHDLLNLLQENKVPIPRAVWYVRGLGGNETVCRPFLPCHIMSTPVPTARNA